MAGARWTAVRTLSIVSSISTTMPRLKPSDGEFPNPIISGREEFRSILAITALTCEFPMSIPDIKYGFPIFLKLVALFSTFFRPPFLIFHGQNREDAELRELRARPFPFQSRYSAWRLLLLQNPGI